MSVMTYKEIQDEVIAFRFREAQRSSVKRWINHRYTWVNAQADWPWLSSYIYTKVWAGDGNAHVLDETQNRRVIEVWDDDNDVRLQFLPLDQFLEIYGGDDTATTGMAHFSLGGFGQPFAGLLYVGPQHVGGNLRLVTETRPELLSGDSDQPAWPEDYHFNLVLGASSTGLKLENDPTWEALETEFLAMVQLMKDELLPPLQPEPRQFGREPFDVWT